MQPAVYIPQEQWTLRKMAVVVRAENDDAAALIPAIRRELAAMDPTIPAVFAVYSDVIAASLARQRLGALMLVVFGLVSLTLAAVGTYGLIAFSVNQRFNEIAVRSAFGAERESLLADVRQARAATRCHRHSARRRGGDSAASSRREPTLRSQRARSVGARAVPLTMLAVTALASYLPARRASRIDVTAALREN